MPRSYRTMIALLILGTSTAGCVIDYHGSSYAQSARHWFHHPRGNLIQRHDHDGDGYIDLLPLNREKPEVLVLKGWPNRNPAMSGR